MAGTAPTVPARQRRECWWPGSRSTAVPPRSTGSQGTRVALAATFVNDPRPAGNRPHEERSGAGRPTHNGVPGRPASPYRGSAGPGPGALPGASGTAGRSAGSPRSARRSPGRTGAFGAPAVPGAPARPSWGVPLGQPGLRQGRQGAELPVTSACSASPPPSRVPPWLGVRLSFARRPARRTSFTRYCNAPCRMAACTVDVPRRRHHDHVGLVAAPALSPGRPRDPVIVGRVVVHQDEVRGLGGASHWRSASAALCASPARGKPGTFSTSAALTRRRGCRRPRPGPRSSRLLLGDGSGLSGSPGTAGSGSGSVSASGGSR